MAECRHRNIIPTIDTIRRKTKKRTIENEEGPIPNQLGSEYLHERSRRSGETDFSDFHMDHYCWTGNPLGTDETGNFCCCRPYTSSDTKNLRYGFYGEFTAAKYTVVVKYARIYFHDILLYLLR